VNKQLMARALKITGFLLVLTTLMLVTATARSQSPQPTPATPSTPTLAPTPTPDTRPSVPLPAAISGIVSDANGPVAAAIVQVKGTPNQTITSQDGKFTLQGLGGITLTTITAWASGYFVGWTDLDPKNPVWLDGKPITIALTPLFTTDNNQYDWFTFEGKKGAESCALCHREYAEWSADAHSQSAKNLRFETMYRGTNVQGQEGQPTRLGSTGVPLPPDPSQPDYGPGYRLDNPQRTGNCATCHTPVASKIPNRLNCGWLGCHTDLTTERSKGIIDPGVTPVSLTGNAAEGVSCEFCHKVGDVILDPETKLPLPDMPGILSMKLYRPPDGQQIFFGTLVDINRRVSYSPLEAKSEFCAPCHYGVFGGVVGNGTVGGGTLIYNSYGEWLDSPYSDPQTGKTCQDCHMPVLDTNFTVFPERGGIPRDYVPFHNHLMPGATDEKLLQNAVTMTTTAQVKGDQVLVEVSITNDKTGHDVPTDEPMRHLILVVQATDANGNLLTLGAGPVLPDWSGNYAGQPGRVYAKILRDEWTGESPTAAYWRPVSIVADTRLAAFATDTSRYTFAAPANGAVTVEAHLVFRRAFQKLAEQKGWNDPDIVMEEEKIVVPAD
jgi:hypothetical protein